MKTYVVTAAFMTLAITPVAPAATITTTFIGGTASSSVQGAGTIVDVFNAAAGMWESAIHDSFTLHLDFGWASLDNAAAQHTLDEQGGTPNRETRGTILFDNTSIIPWFLDPTPSTSEEYLTFTENTQNLGAGVISVGRYFSTPTGSAAGALDLFTTALHEIGHGLGLSISNPSFIAESGDGQINVTLPRPYAGTRIPLVAVRQAHFDPEALQYGAVMVGVNGDERRILSAADILAVAQVSQFTNISLNPVPEPSSIVISLGGLCIAYVVRQRRLGGR